jgi:mannitol-1-/sugar-/sorbitol-6-phosphatase
MQQFHCSAILFDLDGVLVDSTRSVDRQWRKWASENHVDPEKVMEIAHGRRTIEVIQLLAPQIDPSAEVERLERMEAEDHEGVTVMPGAADLLSTIPDGRWCVVTSGTRYLARARLKLGDLPVPQVLVSADDVKDGKPHPEPFLYGARLMGVDPKDCLVIEDAPNGLRAAHAAKMKAIALTSTYRAEELVEADAIVDSLTQIHIGSGGRDATMVIDIFGR